MCHKKSVDVAVVGELNIDVILNHIEHFPSLHKEVIAKKMNMALGSSSAIFASNLSVLGSSVGFIGKTGRDEFASFILNSLKEKNVDISNIIQANNSNTGATIILNYGEDRAMVTYPGAMEELTIGDIDFEFLCSAKHVHTSSIFLQPGILTSLSTILKEAKSKGLTTSVDTQWDPSEKWEAAIEKWLPYVDYFLPNLSEFLLLTGQPNLQEGIDVVKAMAPNTTCIIKDGVNGAYCFSRDIFFHQPAFINSDMVDCIGAGDSFNAGFINATLCKLSLQKSVEYGSLIGAISTTKAGGTGAFQSNQEVKEISRARFAQIINF